ncbi:unnamed protein product [Enterobius vermicularis]|uniref:MARVEL domain-containing protein n=1 Tax=Enterobius vermicularis TaxID=51028 RepID=A0A0N4V4W3_ENTVE|nr:unnamed protein product [Enterobius vermicularis]
MSAPGGQTTSEINERHSLRTSAIICALIQSVATVGISLILLIFVHSGRTSITVVLAVVNLFACVAAIVFLALCVLKRKYGRNYDRILHTYLLSMLVEGLASLFAVLFYPLLLLQHLNEWETENIVEAASMTIIGAVMVSYQVFQKRIVEDMLTYMEYNFK